MYTRHNLHEAINFAAMRLQAQAAFARDLVVAEYPELEQVHHRKGHKTYLFVIDHGDREGPTGLVSDVAVLDYETGRFIVIPREQVQGDEPWFRSRSAW